MKKILILVSYSIEHLKGILDPIIAQCMITQHVKELHGLKHRADCCYVELVSEFTGSDKKVFPLKKLQEVL